LQEFGLFINDKKNDTEWLEIAASIHILKTMGRREQEIIELIKNKHGTQFQTKEKQIRAIYKELADHGCVV
jgi:hypothetical protein